MQTIDIKGNTQIGFNNLVKRVSRLNTTELTLFFQELNQTIKGQKSLTPISEETILLKQIKEIIPSSVIRRFKELQKKQHDNSISDKEQAEIIAITDFIEEKSAERVVLLGSLAALRQVPLLDLVQQLQLKNYHA